jgi:pilus assembly protein CpaE
MAIRFSLYYFSEKTGEYLQKIINASPQGIVVQSTTLSTFLPSTINVEADIFFVEYDEGVEGLDLWIEKIQIQPSNPAVFLYVQEANTSTLLKALRLGVQECFINPVKSEEFLKALSRFQSKAVEGPQEKTRVVTFLGSKGGTGSTFVAVNLAYAMAKEEKESVLLFDLDLRSSNIASFLDIQPKYTILDIIDNFDQMDIHYLKNIILARDDGINVLPGPIRMEDSEMVTVHHVEKIIQYIRDQNLYRWILIDTGNQLDEITLKALELSDIVFLLTMLNIPGLRDARKLLETLHILGFGENKVKIVINGYSKGTDIDLKEAQTFLGQEVAATIRFDHLAVVQSINEGRPLLETLPRHHVSEDLRSLVNLLEKGEAKSEGSKGLFSSIGGWFKWGAKS